MGYEWGSGEREGTRYGHAERKRWTAAGGSREFEEQAIDAQRTAVPRFEVTQHERRTITLLILAVALALVPSARAAAADGGAVVSGVVRDAQGVAQMGALVQVLAANSVTVATAFTDQHGRYAIANLHPGKYLVRASATLLVPATRANLQLRTGAVTVVNLTLAALFDTASWLPAERRRADEPDDDWKWTLRSTANRPILRIMQDGDLIEVSTSASETSAREKMRARATVSSGNGEFGAGGVHNVLAIHRMLDDGGDMVLRADVGSTRVPAAFGPSQELEVGYEERQGFSGASLPGSGTGLQTLAVTSGRRMSFGDLAEAEIGGSLQMSSIGQTGVATHPFLRLTAHPTGVWTLHYRMASDRQVQGFEDVTTGQTAIPVALVKNGKLALESGRHQDVAVDRKAGRGTVSFAYYHDALGRTALAGGGNAGPAQTEPIGAAEIPAGMLVDPTTGTFRTFGQGYTTNGARLTISAPIMDGLWVAAEYSTGDAVASETGGLTLFPAALAGLRVESAQAGTLALKGNLKSSGTRVRASYRWQPSKFVTAVDPYSPLSNQAFFSCQVRQPIR
jgi:hypothetical protein